MANKATAAESGTKMATVQLPLNPMNRKDDCQYVAVNGERYRIRRGDTVEVPYYIAARLEQIAKQRMAANDYINKVSKA